jgi:hypothetical protein
MANTNLVDPTMTWIEALKITDAMVRETLIKRVPNYPKLKGQSILDLYTPNQLISAWLIVARGHSD